MSVIISPLNEDQLFVNNKIVERDSDNNWIARVELTQAEQKAFQKYIKSLMS
ncbi:hypothetical protein BN863_28910 [Formosa agariphila KMM 3901]|uniref:Uncharacterized protein n=1 Tax=Formosa agariphila (strain DSM 15362 / KCTC 12365 / LMG 23005 / KMM 3901 / M-2Alg 35-1) TaxID=1347342 RepID=T2KQ18_FORAG|nr:hypothetical protein [Formosa agariphila]CDF80603.1 hypothetical protein BN863_28910 [Formosa agariphila KMM 3901]